MAITEYTVTVKIRESKVPASMKSTARAVETEVRDALRISYGREAIAGVKVTSTKDATPKRNDNYGRRF